MSRVSTASHHILSVILLGLKVGSLASDCPGRGLILGLTLSRFHRSLQAQFLREYKLVVVGGGGKRYQVDRDRIAGV